MRPKQPAYWEKACTELSARDPVLGQVIAQWREVAVSSRGEPFQTLARSIVGQQISVKAAQSVWDRFVALLGAPSTRVAPAMVENQAASALREAVEIDPRQKDRIPSTKGSLNG